MVVAGGSTGKRGWGVDAMEIRTRRDHSPAGESRSIRLGPFGHDRPRAAAPKLVPMALPLLADDGLSSGAILVARRASIAPGPAGKSGGRVVRLAIGRL